MISYGFLFIFLFGVHKNSWTCGLMSFISFIRFSVIIFKYIACFIFSFLPKTPISYVRSCYIFYLLISLLHFIVLAFSAIFMYFLTCVYSLVLSWAMPVLLSNPSIKILILVMVILVLVFPNYLIFSCAKSLIRLVSENFNSWSSCRYV